VSDELTWYAEWMALIRSRVRDARRAKRLTAKEVAARIGISRPFYTQLEGGTRRLTVEYLLRTARAIGVPVSELLLPEPSLGVGDRRI